MSASQHLQAMMGHAEMVGRHILGVENKLQNGDLKGAALEWELLPGAGKEASSDFATKLKNRIEAEESVSAALSQTVAGNGG